MVVARRGALIARGLDQRGTSLVELLVAMLLFSIVGLAAFAGYTSIADTNRKIDDRSLALVEARQALELMIRDVRAADPIDALPSGTPVSAYDSAIAFKIHCAQPAVNGCSANQMRQIRYTFDPATYSLQRHAGTSVTFIGPAGPDSVPLGLQRSAIVNAPAQPVFTYYDALGMPIDTGAGGVAVTNLSLCARRVEIHLVVQAEADRPTSRVDLRTTVDLRNYFEVKQCTA